MIYFWVTLLNNFMETSAIYSLTDLILYQEDSSVSKIIMKNDCGSVTLFAFDTGQSLSEHTAPFDALVNVLEGDVLIRISGKEYTLKANDVIIMPANEPHGLKALTKVKMLLTMLKMKA